MQTIPARYSIQACLVLLLFLFCGAATAATCTPTVRDGWIRMLPGMMLGGFARIENPCADAVTIVSASSAVFADTTLHLSTVVDGVSRMRPISELRIASSEAVVLAPGKLHLMLMQPIVPLKAGGRVTILFKLRNGLTFPGEFALRAPGG